MSRGSEKNGWYARKTDSMAGLGLRAGSAFPAGQDRLYGLKGGNMEYRGILIAFCFFR